MNDTLVMLEPSVVDSIVLGAAERETRRLGFTLTPAAKHHLLKQSIGALNRENEEGRLDSRRDEVERNTASLMQMIVEHIASQPGREISQQHMMWGLSGFCTRFPDFFPFCT